MSKASKLSSALKVLVVVTCGVVASNRAMAVPCGFEHEVSKGDSLSLLSGMDAHYAVQDYWPILYSYNRDRLGNDPDLIHPGMMLRIPCLDESGQPLPGQFVESGGQNSVAMQGHNHNHQQDQGEAKKQDEADSATMETASSETDKKEESMAEQAASTETEVTHNHSQQEQPAQQVAVAESKPETTESVELKPAEPTATGSTANSEIETKTANAAEPKPAVAEETEPQKPAEPEEPQEPVQTATTTTETAVATEQAESAPDAAMEQPTAETEQPISVAKVEPGGSATPVATVDSIRLLTADEFGLFNDKNTINAGLAMRIIEAALNENGDVSDFRISKVNDWSAHIDPLLSSHAFDLGFPWIKPDCSDANELCDNFIFSNPIMEVANIIIVEKSSSIDSLTADSVKGLTLCRPSSFDKDDFDSDGRNWLSGSVVLLKQPFNVSECFDQLLSGEVDAVSVNEYHARSTISSLDIAEKVKILDTSPFPGVALHALVHRAHPSAERMIGTLNASIDAIRNSGAYDAIVDQK